MDPWELPLDVLLDIVLHLPLPDVLALRQTCKAFCAVTRMHALWALLFRTHVLAQRIPCPDLPAPLADLGAPELESLTHRALALRRAWTAPDPVPRRRLTFNTATEPDARIIFLQFLPGRAHRWLISVRMAVRPRVYLLQCWDVAAPRPRCVAELRHADGPYGGIVLNSDPTSTAVLAMQSAQTETFSIDFDAEDPECAFETLATIDGIRELHLLAGTTLVTRRTDDGGALCLWDLADLARERVQLRNPSLVQPDDRIQAIHLAHDYAVVVRVQTVEIYTTTPRPNLLPVRGAPIAYPLAQFKFQWRTDAVVLSEQHAPTDPHLPRPIHLCVRFASIYPWPVNVLHQYVLAPNPLWRKAPRAQGRTTPPCTSENNLPYNPRPHPTHTVSSPVRLFSQSAMAIGRYGTALWLDNHTEDVLAPSEHGQRLAGRMVRWPLEGADRGKATKAAAARAYASTRPDGTAKPVIGPTSSASMVFGVREDDVWSHVAMAEQAGRIVVGHVDGAITLLEY